ncbi:hypothetical protein I79_008030 [Cricetulus griseus]|uniref:Uncharacterized protein n=1 Tax=Cricetulus griseus TaxID=10029 RepID=G3HBZ3_CRIGR|nr:hypothetical protein I79_008030 [Cricetulus griseus]
MEIHSAITDLRPEAAEVCPEQSWGSEETDVIDISLLKVKRKMHPLIVGGVGILS